MTSIHDEFVERVHARRCVVIGSASVSAFGVDNDQVMVAVNGGITNCPDWPIHVWVLNARATNDAAHHPLYPTMVKQGANRHVGMLVLFTWGSVGDPVAETLARLKKQGTTWDDLIELNHDTRKKIEIASGGRSPTMLKHAISAGLSAACLCFWAGAASVRLEGMSWTPGYAYQTPRPVPNRGHVAGDRAAIARLDVQYKDRFSHKWSKESAGMATRKTVRPALPPTEAWQGPLPRRVRATKTTYYGSMRQREGVVFTLRSPAHFKASCMVDVSPDAVSTLPDQKVAAEEARSLARAMAGRRLAPNAVDVLPDGQAPELVGMGASRDVL